MVQGVERARCRRPALGSALPTGSGSGPAPPWCATCGPLHVGPAVQHMFAAQQGTPLGMQHRRSCCSRGIKVSVWDDP